MFEQRRRPLKIGIRLDVLAALDGAVTDTELGLALHYYTGNSWYLRMMTTGAARITSTVSLLVSSLKHRQLKLLLYWNGV
jgi:sRNA-binding protein